VAVREDNGWIILAQCGATAVGGDENLEMLEVELTELEGSGW
jgi:hypothetical protein